jgi:hypothetical protein
MCGGSGGRHGRGRSRSRGSGPGRGRDSAGYNWLRSETTRMGQVGSDAGLSVETVGVRDSERSQPARWPLLTQRTMVMAIKDAWTRPKVLNKHVEPRHACIESCGEGVGVADG